MAQSMTAIVLAAGLSRRMGNKNKLLLPFGDNTILGTTLTQILNAQLGATLLVLGHEATTVWESLCLSDGVIPNHSVAIIVNANFEKGITTSIQTGVAAADKAGRGAGYIICLSDMPFITSADYQYLTTEFLKRLAVDNQAIVQPVFKNERGNPTIFSSFYKKHILELNNTEGCKPIVQAYKKHVYLVEMPTDAVLRDIDVQEEYAAIMSK